jgi:regulator of protease activity HflC (stomatin/prohibitin superfamily)
MSDPGTFHPLRHPGEPEPAAQPPKRAGSVTLTQQTESDGERSMLDPANQSLADSLRVMMWLLQAGMLILAGLYVLSGIQTVREGEQGIRLLFGRKQATNLEPGATWSAPYPLGELVKVGQGERSLLIDRDFWQYVEAGGDPSPEKLVPKVSLKPFEGGTGSVLTADGNIAHTRWRVTYSRGDAAKYAQNVLNQQEEENLVRAAAKRGIVHAASRVGIEQLLRQGMDQEGGIARYATQVAQQTLDASESGLRIDRLDPLDTIPPSYVKADFARVQSAESNAGKARENGRAGANQRLLETAGQAAPLPPPPPRRIRSAHRPAHRRPRLRRPAHRRQGRGRHGRHPSQHRLHPPRPARRGAAGEVILASEIRTLAGGRVEGISGGSVANTLASARTYRTSVVNRARNDLAKFQARLAQFQANPSVTIYREWSQSVAAFMRRDSVQYFLFPAELGVLNLQLNPDPDILRPSSPARSSPRSSRTSGCATASAPSTNSRSRSARARSSACSGPTARARAPPSR